MVYHRQLGRCIVFDMVNRDYGATMDVKLVEIKEPEIPLYLKGILEGIEAGYRLGVLVAFHFEGYDGKEMSRLLLEVTGPGRNLDATIIKTPRS